MSKETKVKYGQRFKKPDIDRIGIFAEMSYMHGAGYVSLFPRPNYLQGTNFLGEGPKLKAGKADCYFDKEFRRIFEGEACKRGPRKLTPLEAKKLEINRKANWLIVGPTKLHATPGDWYGTFDTAFYYMSKKARKEKPAKPEGRNFLTNNGRKGNSGYINICMNPYPKHSDDRYGYPGNWKQYGKILKGPMYTSSCPGAYFEPNPYKLPNGVPFAKTYVKPESDKVGFLGPGKIQPIGPGKKLGGCKAGGFSKYPPHSEDKHCTVWDLEKPKKLIGRRWNVHPTALKTMFTHSIIDHDVPFRLNEKTLNTYEPTFVQHLLD